MMSDTLLRDFLVDAGVLSRGQVEGVAHQAQGKPLARALVDSGLMTEDEVRRASAHALGVPFVELSRDTIAEQALMRIPEPLCRARRLVAYGESEEGLQVALLDLADLESLEPLRAQLPRLLPRLTTRESMRRALLHYQKLLKDRFGAALRQESEPRQLLEALLRHALLMRASEVRLESDERGVLVRYRTAGAVHEALSLPHAAGSLFLAVRELARVPSRHLPQEGRFAFDLGSGEEVLVRVSCVPSVGAERLVLHITPPRAHKKGFTLESLGLHGEAQEMLRSAVAKPGLVLVGGTPGSGRSTLLYTLLDLLSDSHASLCSVERRVSYRLPHVAQTQVDPTVGLSVASALRAVLRHDPEVVAVDELDQASAPLAVAAAARGVVVLAAVDAAGAHEALGELERFGVSRGSLLPLLRASVGLALARRLCTRESHGRRKLSRAEQDELEPRADFTRVFGALKQEDKVAKDAAWKDLQFPQARGCSECAGGGAPGYQGFVGLQEVVAPHASSLSLIEDGLFKAATGETSIEEVLRLSLSTELPAD